MQNTKYNFYYTDFDFGSASTFTLITLHATILNMTLHLPSFQMNPLVDMRKSGNLTVESKLN